MNVIRNRGDRSREINIIVQNNSCEDFTTWLPWFNIKRYQARITDTSNKPIFINIHIGTYIINVFNDA